MKSSLFTRAAAYLQIVSMGAQVAFVYRSNSIFQLASVLLQIYLLKVIWTAIYMQQGVNNQVHLQTLISYLTLANLQTWVLTPTITEYLQQRIRTGAIALDLAKPISFPGQLVARQLGATLSLLPFVLIALPLAFFAGGLQLPASGAAIIYYIVSCTLSYLVVALMGLLMGLLALWTFEVTGIQFIYRFVNQLFAGALIPLWLFPPVLHTVATFLPFQAVAFLPVSIYLGQLQGAGITDALTIQLVWVVVLYLFAQLVWYRAQRHIVIQGG